MTRKASFTLGLLLTATLAYATHGHWIDHYKTSTGASCCRSQKDCLPAHARILEMDEPFSWVEVDGMKYRMPTASIHVSEDEQDWFCRWPYTVNGMVQWVSPICLFIAPGT